MPCGGRPVPGPSRRSCLRSWSPAWPRTSPARTPTRDRRRPAHATPRAEGRSPLAARARSPRRDRARNRARDGRRSGVDRRAPRHVQHLRGRRARRDVTGDGRGADCRPGARLLADVDELHDDEVFDLLCAFEVLEHIRDDRDALDQLGPPRAARWPRAGIRAGRARPLGSPRRAGRAHAPLHARRSRGVVPSPRASTWSRSSTTGSRSRTRWRRRATSSPGDGSRASRGDAATRTAGSGRHLQPPPWAGGLIWWATAPVRVVQRRFPDRGPGLVARPPPGLTRNRDAEECAGTAASDPTTNVHRSIPDGTSFGNHRRRGATERV